MATKIESGVWVEEFVIADWLSAGMTRSVAEAVGVDGATGVGVDKAEQAASRIRVEVSIANKINRVGFIIYLIAKCLCKI